MQACTGGPRLCERALVEQLRVEILPCTWLAVGWLLPSGLPAPLLRAVAQSTAAGLGTMAP